MKDQMAKAGIVHSEMPTQIHIDFDELEVTLLFKCYLHVGICLWYRFSCIELYHLWQIKLGEIEAELIEVNSNNEKLQRAYNELVEYMLVLKKV